MRVIVLVKASAESEAGQMPSEELLTQMGNYNEELVKAGVMRVRDSTPPRRASEFASLASNGP